MAVEEEKNKKDESKGFAGLSSLVSDVGTSPLPSAKNEPSNTSGASSSPPPPTSQTAQPQPRQEETYQDTPQPSSGSSGGKWVLGIAAVIGVLWLIGQSDKSPTSPAPTYSPPAQSAMPSYSPPAEPQAPTRPQESMPPVGQDLVFSTAQIHYCLAEDIRLEGAKSALNNYIDTDVDRFNAMVADYNSRCGSYRYRSGALESARRDIEPYRSQLQSEGESRVGRSPSTGSLSTPAPSSPAPDATVQTIQSKLNELGYEAGTADGLMGRGTRLAIQAFQRDNGLAVDGSPTAALLQLLMSSRQPERQEPPAPSVPVVTPTYTPPTQAPSRQESARPSSGGIPQNARLNYLGNDWECKPGYFKYGNECPAVQVPQNGKLTYLGNDWECKPGYFKYGNECPAVQVPQNGKLTYLGNDWECKPGYFKYGNECRAVQVPQNGKLTYLANDWECNPGYFKYGNECRAVQVPQNGKLTYLGNDWECNRGYFKYANECRAVQVPPNGKLTYLGNDWDCERGYKKSGDKCVSAFPQ